MAQRRSRPTQRAGMFLFGRRAGRLDAQIRSKRPAVGDARDVVAAKAAVLQDQFVTAQQLDGRRLREPFAGRQIDDLMMAFQAGAFGKPRRPHRIEPKFVGGPTVLFAPAAAVRFAVRRVRRPWKRCRAALSAVTDRATELGHRMGTRRTDVQIQARMRSERMNQAAANRQGHSRPAFRRRCVVRFVLVARRVVLIARRRSFPRGQQRGRPLLAMIDGLAVHFDDLVAHPQPGQFYRRRYGTFRTQEQGLDFVAGPQHRFAPRRQGF